MDKDYKMMNYDSFIHLLKILDEKLSERSIFIDIKAIGGFAMIYWAKEYHQSGRNASRDIDSLSKLTDEVVELVRLIGIKEDADEDWLNNDWLKIKKGNEELEYFADWRQIRDHNFTNIDLYVLDLETLFFFKMRAINEKLEAAKESPRIQDVRDVYLILKLFGETNIYSIKNAKMASCIRYFPMARDYMSGREPK